jgi:cytochrome c peroxidase
LFIALVLTARVEADISWSEREIRILRSLHIGEVVSPPPSASNRVADDSKAASLGRKIFFDARFSANGSLSCASCHQPDRYYTDNQPRAKGMAKTARNTPTVVGSSHLGWFYWDGRRDSLWSQALIPFEAKAEMGSNRTAVIQAIGRDDEYRREYESVFGTFPQKLLDTQLPANAGPLSGDAERDAWQQIPAATARQINEVYANIGKSLAAFERTLQPSPTRFDRYVSALLAGEDNADDLLTTDEIAGLKLFLDSDRTRCLQCHNGPFFTNGGFHNIGTGNLHGEHLDFGRVFGLRAVLMDEFNCLGNYSDARPEQCLELRFLNQNAHVPLEGAFKVPGLRNLAKTYPYMHDGRYETLAEVIAHYREPPDNTHELKALDLSKKEAQQLMAFLLSLGVDPIRQPVKPDGK